MKVTIGQVIDGSADLLKHSGVKPWTIYIICQIRLDAVWSEMIQCIDSNE